MGATAGVGEAGLACSGFKSGCLQIDLSWNLQQKRCTDGLEGGL